MVRSFDRLYDRPWISTGVSKSGMIVGGVDRAVEIAVVDLTFAFWQVYGRDGCDILPHVDDGRRELISFLRFVSPPEFNADRSLRSYTPYYYQALRQLGSPQPYETPVADLLRYPGADAPPSLVPDRLQPVPRDEEAIPDVDRWVRTRATRILFLYGGDDPWSAEPFRCGSGGAERQCRRLVVPGATHGVSLGQLPPKQRQAVTARLFRWAGLDPATARSVPRHAAGAEEHELLK